MDKQKKLQEYNNDYFLFLEAGFVAVNQCDEDSALKLFMAAQILRPDNVFPKIGYGYMHMCKLELKQAEEMFNAVLRSDPRNELALSFLGITKSFMPNKSAEGEKILAELGKITGDEDMKKLVNTSQDFIETHIKKPSTSPMDLAKPKKKK